MAGERRISTRQPAKTQKSGMLTIKRTCSAMTALIQKLWVQRSKFVQLKWYCLRGKWQMKHNCRTWQTARIAWLVAALRQNLDTSIYTTYALIARYVRQFCFYKWVLPRLHVLDAAIAQLDSGQLARIHAPCIVQEVGLLAFSCSLNYSIKKQEQERKAENSNKFGTKQPFQHILAGDRDPASYPTKVIAQPLCMIWYYQSGSNWLMQTILNRGQQKDERMVSAEDVRWCKTSILFNLDNPSP